PWGLGPLPKWGWKTTSVRQTDGPYARPFRRRALDVLRLHECARRAAGHFGIHAKVEHVSPRRQAPYPGEATVDLECRGVAAPFRHPVRHSSPNDVDRCQREDAPYTANRKRANKSGPWQYRKGKRLLRIHPAPQGTIRRQGLARGEIGRGDDPGLQRSR